MILDSILSNLSAIAIGGGPSSKRLIGLTNPMIEVVETPEAYKSVQYDRPKLFGCGDVSTYLTLDYYCYGDATHQQHIPPPPCVIYASQRNYQEAVNTIDVTASPIHEFPVNSNWPSAGSAGGMTLTLACQLTNGPIGVIGFDGFSRTGVPYNPDSQKRHRDIIEYFTAKGKILVSLMDVSVFNDTLVNMQAYYNITQTSKDKA